MSELVIGDVPVPSPRPREVLLRVRASSLNPLDVALRTGRLRPFVRLGFPAILGSDVAGEVERAGDLVRAWVPGDRVYGRVGAPPGGAHAEFAVIAADAVDRIPESLSFTEAAALPLAATAALQALSRVRLAAGERLLVIGAAGGVGLMAMQLGRAIGAEVEGRCSAAGAAMLAALGLPSHDYADVAFDGIAGGFDVILDTVQAVPPPEALALLRPRGRYITTRFSPRLLWLGVIERLRRGRRVTFLRSRAEGRAMRTISGLVRDGRLRPVIDSVYPLDRIADAHRRVESGHAHGKVIVDLQVPSTQRSPLDAPP